MTRKSAVPIRAKGTHGDRQTLVLKHGRQIMRVVSDKTASRPLIGSLRGCVLGDPDVVSPTGEVWEAEVI